MKDKLKAIGRFFGRIAGAVAPFLPDPKAKAIAGATAAVLNAATEDKPNDKAEDTVQGGV